MLNITIIFIEIYTERLYSISTKTDLNESTPKHVTFDLQGTQPEGSCVYPCLHLHT